MYRNIVFDFGGVLLNLEPDATRQSMQTLLGSVNVSRIFEENQNLLNKFETGKIGFENFIWNIQRLCDKVPNPRDVVNAWNAMLKGWEKEKLDLLYCLKSDFNLYLLSNTNEIHLQWVRNDLWRNHQINDFEQRFFKKVFYSHLVGWKKPGEEIFIHLINETGINPGETLYIDDLPENVETAGKLGFQTVLHQRNASLSYLISDGKN